MPMPLTPAVVQPARSRCVLSDTGGGECVVRVILLEGLGQSPALFCGGCCCGCCCILPNLKAALL